MIFKIFTVTFGSIFLAELADKTQFVSMGMSAKSGRPGLVWLASVCAYMVVTAISVIIGSAAGKYFKPELIRYCGGIIFIFMGVLILLKKV